MISAMNIFRISCGGILFLLVAFLNSGCASHPRTMVNTWSDPAYMPTAASPIALNIPVGAKPEDAAFGDLLRAELTNESFHLVSADQADFLLSYVVSENEEEHESAPIHRIGPPEASAQNTGQIINPIPGPTGGDETPEKSYVVSTRDVRLFLYTNPKTNPKGLRLAWQGTITIDKGATPERQTALLRILLADFGKNYNGPVTVEPQTKN